MRRVGEIVQELRAKIDNGLYAYEQKLPPATELAVALDTSYITARKAIGKLAEEGYLVSRRGQGTFVMRRCEAGDSSVAKNDVGLVMRTDSHLFGELVNKIQLQVNSLGCGAKVFPFSAKEETGLIARSLEELIKSNPYGIVMEYTSDKKCLDLIAKAVWAGVAVVWLMCEKPPVGIGGDLVTYDNVEAYSSILDHLAGLGHRRIGIYALEEFFRGDSAWYSAVSAICEKYGELEIVNHVGASDSTADEEMQRLRVGLLECSSRPTAVVCSLDYRAHMVKAVAEKIGLKIPEDISVTGLFNTPWSHIDGITSVDMGLDDIANGVALSLKRQNENCDLNVSSRIYVTPKLVVRGSTSRPRSIEYELLH